LRVRLSFDDLAVHLVNAGLMIVVVTRQTYLVEVEFVFNGFQLFFKFLRLFERLIDNLVNVILHINVIFVAGQDDFLGSVLNH